MEQLRKYSDVIAYMYARLPMYYRQGASAYKKDLTNIKTLCEHLGQPHESFPTVHVAGTNGKGTVSHLISGGLQMQGYKVGLYTSPHYKDFRERIKIDGQLIDKKYIISFINDLRPLIETIQPSFFEITVALAFSWFKHNKVDVAVIEVGLGGRLDSTNIITPVLSVITNISFDHMDMLGNTLPLIAAEKAGIIKQGVPVVIGEKQEGIHDVFLEKAKDCLSDVIEASSIYSVEGLTSSKNKHNFSIHRNGKKWKENFVTDLIAPYHSKNIITAMAALQALNKSMPVDLNIIQRRFLEMRTLTYYIGRWQVIHEHPTVLVDSAHNEGGMKYVSDLLNSKAKGDLHIVMGFVNDKDLSKVLHLFPQKANYYFAKANIPRGLDAELLQEKALEFNLIGRAYTSVPRALAAAKRSCAGNGFIFVGGSIFVVAEVL